MRRKMDFLRHATPKMGIKKKPCSWQGFTNHFGRMNLSLIGCFPAEPISVSIQHFKIHSTKLYLQPVKFSNQLPTEENWCCSYEDEEGVKTHSFIFETNSKIRVRMM